MQNSANKESHSHRTHEHYTNQQVKLTSMRRGSRFQVNRQEAEYNHDRGREHATKCKKKKERELRFHCFLYSQANLVSKLLKQMAKAWKAESGYR